jgi:hypothetical protein
MLGGSIEVSSQLGVGSVFTVRLPYVNPRDLSGSKKAVSLDIVEAARAAALRAGLQPGGARILSEGTPHKPGTGRS